MPNYIETDMKHDKEFFKKYINGKWEDSNKLYKEYMSWENRKFFVQEINEFDRPLLRKIKEMKAGDLVKLHEFTSIGFRESDLRTAVGVIITTNIIILFYLH